MKVVKVLFYKKDEEVEIVIRYECFGQNQLPRLSVIYIKKGKQEKTQRSKIER